MATVRMTSGAVLGMVSDTAGAVSSLVNTVAGGLEMVNNYVQRQKENQTERSVVERITFRQNLIEEASLDATQRREKINSYLDGNPRREEIFGKVNAEIIEAFKAFDKKDTDEA